jgi:hypothetical protein
MNQTITNFSKIIPDNLKNKNQYYQPVLSKQGNENINS